MKYLYEIWYCFKYEDAGTTTQELEIQDAMLQRTDQYAKILAESHGEALDKLQSQLPDEEICIIKLKRTLSEIIC